MDIQDTLKERGNRYGTLFANGCVAQQLKGLFRNHDNWNLLSFDKQEALDQIASKIARVFSGDSNYKDNWHDIAGYATCVENTLQEARSREFVATRPNSDDEVLF